MLGGVELAGGKIGVELAQLVAVDGNVGVALRWGRPDHRSQEKRDRAGGKRGADQPEDDHSRSFAARARSASDSSGGPGRGFRMRRTRIQNPASSSTNGPIHSASVLALSGGR